MYDKSSQGIVVDTSKHHQRKVSVSPIELVIRGSLVNQLCQITSKEIIHVSTIDRIDNRLESLFTAPICAVIDKPTLKEICLTRIINLSINKLEQFIECSLNSVEICIQIVGASLLLEGQNLHILISISYSRPLEMFIKVLHLFVHSI